MLTDPSSCRLDTSPKNESILQMLKGYTLSEETTLSPSALNAYIDCPLKFYFKYVAGIKEKEEIRCV